MDETLWLTWCEDLDAKKLRKWRGEGEGDGSSSTMTGSNRAVDGIGGVMSSELPLEDTLRAEDDEGRRSIATDWREDEREERGLVVEARERRDVAELGESTRGGERGRRKPRGPRSIDCRR